MPTLRIVGKISWQNTLSGFVPKPELTVMQPVSSVFKQSPKFRSTAWTMVVEATGEGPTAQQALESLCQVYWYPIYAFVRRNGMRSADAEDATQAFFAWLIESGVVGRADPERGRFRSFLITAVKRFLLKRREYETAAKRTPQQPLLSLDMRSGEQRYEFEPCDPQTPETLFEYSWAINIIDIAMQRLRNEWVEVGRGEYFDALKGFIVEQSNLSGRDLAKQLNQSEGAVRVAIHRLKRRFAEVLREEVGRTLEEHENIEEELRHLFDALRP
jgi:RNA polymerase sigma factor (sigma-70 family)